MVHIYVNLQKVGSFLYSINKIYAVFKAAMMKRRVT